MAIEDTVLSQYATGFKANLNLAPQQKDVRLASRVDAEYAYEVPGQFWNMDDVGTTDPEPVDGRVPNTPDKFINMTRRVGIFQPFQDAQWIDNVDKARELEDPTSKIMMAIMAGQNRHRDIQTLIGLMGNAYSITGPIGSATGVPTASALPAAQIIASTDVTYAHDAETVPTDGSQYGMSIGKLIHAGLLLDESELEGERYFACSSYEIADLKRRTPATSRYYSDVMALSSGKIDNFLGFNIIRLQKQRFIQAGVGIGYSVGYDGVSPIINCPAWIEPAVEYKGRPITEAVITKRPDRSMTPQAFYKMEDGAGRRYDTGVVQVGCYTGAPY
jgi:hypothetical protein